MLERIWVGCVLWRALAGGASPPVALEQREYRGECVLEWRERWGGYIVAGLDGHSFAAGKRRGVRSFAASSVWSSENIGANVCWSGACVGASFGAGWG